MRPAVTQHVVLGLLNLGSISKGFCFHTDKCCIGSRAPRTASLQKCRSGFKYYSVGSYKDGGLCESLSIPFKAMVGENEDFNRMKGFSFRNHLIPQPSLPSFVSQELTLHQAGSSSRALSDRDTCVPPPLPTGKANSAAFQGLADDAP